jgi:hypothetical protein
MSDRADIDPARLPMWVVYDHPTDYPDGWLARLWYSLPQPQATGLAIAAGALDTLRDHLAERGCTVIPRSEGDDPAIVESWLL